MWLLVASCFLITAPVSLSDDPRRYYLTLGVGFCEEDGVVHWWHYLVENFMHGAGCGFPPIWFHIGVNVTLFLFQGAIVERVLGSGRAALLTFGCLAVHVPIVYVLVGGRAHGASSMTWSYLIFAIDWLVWSFRRYGWKACRDPLTDFEILLALFGIVGLIKHWHLWNLLASVPFYLAWRKTWRGNLEALEKGESINQGQPIWNRAGSAFAAAVFAFNAFFLVQAVTGKITPIAVEKTAQE
jgi:hypothetical protein